MSNTEEPRNHPIRPDQPRRFSENGENNSLGSDLKPLILIVDDNAENLQYLGNLLSGSRYEPAVTINGAQALEFLEQDIPELILLDIMMPEMDGFELCQRIKSNPKWRNIPIIFLTAKTDSEDLVKGFDLGAIDYLTKPFNPNELLVRVKTHIDLHQTKIALQRSNTALRKREEEINELNKILASKVEEKTEKLEHAQDEILQQGYKSALAEITTETLHNVKNLLNSVKISSEMIMEEMFKSRSATGLKKANQLLRENMDSIEDFICNDPKGKILLDYYLNIEDLLDLETKSIKQELQLISEKVITIESIIMTQQVYGKKQAESELLDLHKVIDDARNMLHKLIVSHNIAVEIDFAEIPLLHLQKQKFLHVLINLIRNAKDALVESGNPERILAFKTEAAEDRVILTVSDNGCGIKQDDLSKLFNHGFTTKKDGHGFGLHSSMNYIREMDGQITAHSKGPGKGAQFEISLPRRA